MILKPPRWNVSPALVSAEARDLWKDVAFIAPMWDAAGGKGALLGPNGQPLAGANLVAGSTAEKRATPYGLGVGISGASNLLTQADFPIIKTSNGIWTGDHTVVCFANPIAESRASMGLAQNPTGGFYPGISINFNAGNISGDFRVEFGASSPNITGPVDGTYRMWGGVRRGATNYTYIDGIVRQTRNNSGQAIGNATADFALGNLAGSSGYRISTSSSIVFAAGWNRALTDAEMRMLARDPFIMFRMAEISPSLLAVAGGITGALSVTEADDTLTGAGSLSITGAAAITEAGDTLTGAGALTITGAAGITEDSDTLAATGELAITGLLSAIEADDTLTSAGALAITGSASITESGDTTAATGALAITGALAATETGDTLSASGTGAAVTTGALAVTESGDTLAATGELPITGSAAITESGDTVAATGVLPIAGAAAITEDSDSIVSTGALAITGTANITEADDTLSTSTAAEVNAIVFRIPAEPVTFMIPAEPVNFRIAS